MPPHAEWPVAAPIETERLALEPLRVEHAPDMVSVLGDPALYTFTGGEPPTLPELEARFARQAVGLAHQRQGYATEAAVAMVQWLRRQGVVTLTAHIRPDHLASIAVARRLGLVATGLIVDGEMQWAS